jgi:hypothetical protein
MFLCIDEINKVILGDTGSWPLEEIHKNRVQNLKSKTVDLGRTVAVRPCPPLYSEIVKVCILLSNLFLKL